jgi:hypothetical protein
MPMADRRKRPVTRVEPILNDDPRTRQPMPTGLPADSSGRATIDPTKNVGDLVASEGRRHDDLRDAQDERITEAVQRSDDLRKAFADLVDAKITHLSDLSQLRYSHAEAMASVRAFYQQLIDTKEAARLDAIRAVDQAAVQRSAEVQQAVAATLASQVAAAAEANRTSVAAAAAAIEVKLATTLAPLNEAVSDLRRMQFQLQGQTAEKAERREVDTGVKGGNQWMVTAAIAGCGLLIAGAGVLITLLTIGVAVVVFLVNK